MEIGISSACFYPKVDLENSITLMKSLGFDKGEIFLNSPCEFDDEFLEKLIFQKEENNFKINSIHPFSSFFEPYLFDKYKRRREDMTKYFKRVCLICKRLGAKFYTFHGLRRIDLRFLDKDFIVDIYNRLAYIALENEIEMAQENVSWCMASDIDFLKMINEKCKYPIKFTLDIKQAYRAKVPIDDYIKVMNNNIVNLHLNDVDGENTCLLPGRGSIDYKSLYQKLLGINYKGMAIIEIYSDNYSQYQELMQCKEYLSKQFI